MSKVERIRNNLFKYLRDAMSFVELMLEDHAPPTRSALYRVRMRVYIEEIADDGAVVGTFEFERAIDKSVVG